MLPYEVKSPAGIASNRLCEAFRVYLRSLRALSRDEQNASLVFTAIALGRSPATEKQNTLDAILHSFEITSMSTRRIVPDCGRDFIKSFVRIPASVLSQSSLAHKSIR